jgi:Tfp pilus assembly protein PilF
MMMTGLGACLLAGCDAVTGDSGIRTAPDPRRNTPLAKQLTAQGANLLGQEKYEEAEAKLKEAVEADLFYGPAHNNLGLAHFHQQEFYDAAWQLQQAADLMPTQAEPRNNLGLVFEAVGKLRQAAEAYQKALALEPEAIEPLRHLARTLIRQNRLDAETRQLLEKLVMKETDPAWRNWAESLLQTGSFSPL